MLGFRSEIDRPTSESMRFSMGSMACVKRRIFRSFPTMTNGTVMPVSTFDRSLFTSISATLRVSQFLVHRVQFFVGRLELFFGGFQFLVARLGLFVGGLEFLRGASCSSIID